MSIEKRAKVSKQAFNKMHARIVKDSEQLKNDLQSLLVLGASHYQTYGDGSLVAIALTDIKIYLPVPAHMKKAAMRNVMDWVETYIPHTFSWSEDLGTYKISKKNGTVPIILEVAENTPTKQLEPLAFVDEMKQEKRAAKKAAMQSKRETVQAVSVNMDTLAAFIAHCSIDQLADLDTLLQARKAELKPAKKQEGETQEIA